MMKYSICYLLLVPIILASMLSVSCDKKVDEQLDSIEETLSTEPSAAYEGLTSISPRQIRTRASQARYALLMSLAMDKNYIDTANDSLILIASQYYEKHGSLRDKMLSLYMMGRVQRNAENSAGAIVSLLKAKELAEEIEDLHYIGLCSRNIAEMYGQYNDEESEILYYRESVRAFDGEDKPLYAAYSRLGEARGYMANNQRKRADSLLTVIERFARGNSAILLYRVLMDRAMNNMYLDSPDANFVLSLYREADTLGVHEKETSDYGSLARVFEMLGYKDSVSYYLSLTEQSAKTRIDSIHLFNTLASLYISRGDYQSANEQLRRGVVLHNRMVFNGENQLLANAISDYSQKEAVRQEEKASHRLHLLILSMLGILALLIIMIQLIIIRRRQLQDKNRIILEKERKIEEDMAQIQEIAEELRAFRTGRTEMSETINALIQDKITIVKMCADAYEAVKNEPKSKSDDPYHYLDVDPIKQKTEQMRLFLNALDQFRQDDSLFSLLEGSVNAARSDIMIRLRDTCSKNKMAKPQFEEDDFRMLMLFYAGVPDRTIAFLMDMSCSAVRTRKTRYKERLMRPDVYGGAFFVQQISSSR